MTVRTSPWPAGVPCWADLSVPDVDRAMQFYSAVLGWDMASGNDEFGGYVSAGRGGNPAAGVSPQREAGPVAWTLYLASGDVDATAAAIRSAGGTVTAEPADVGELGRMCMATDPSGAVFGVWQAGSHIGASLVNEPGGITWEDLRSTDPDRAREFYVSVFGFDTAPIDMAGPDYQTFSLRGDSAPLGGIGPMMGAADAGSHWMIYFSVADAAAAAAEAEQAGAAVLMPVTDTPYGRMAALADPDGASFTIMQNTGQPQPDRAD